ncbi:hypothetical protein ACHAXA_008770 [Cyclostephanos tholiformis]|uniref:Transmembrane protein n=1 Tax=Cyclostephanos tholiformis TaxID=382380 RepID=A0ABD3RD19_9STRA
MSEAVLRANSIRRTRTRLWRNPKKFLFVLVCLTVAVKRSILFVGADSIVVITKPEIDDDPSTDIVVEENDDVSRQGNIAEPPVADVPAEDPVRSSVSIERNVEVLSMWPTSLARAARVGAKLREKSTDVKRQESEVNNPNTNNEVGTANNPMMLTGCHWGTIGCKKGNWNSDEMNSSSVDNNADTGMASASTDARVLKGRGPSLNLHRPASTGNLLDGDDAESGRKPPQGFKLAGRIITSPSDGLSYFLDAPKVYPEDNNGDWMLTIPYRYLECGPTIESTTEAFPLTDMVLRHFPHSASMSHHWMNLGGGVTLENGLNKDERGGTRYIDTDGNNEGHPKLLVALTPIEITVSGNNEETRVFNPGDVILMEDTLGKGHKMNAAPVVHDKAQLSKRNDARGNDLYVIMVSLPHTVHLPVYDWLEGSSYLHESSSSSVQDFSSSVLSKSPTDYNGPDIADDNPDEEEATRALLGFAPKHLHHKLRHQRERTSLSSESKIPCPLEYDSAYSSLFIPPHKQYKRLHRNRSRPNRGENQFTTVSSFDETNPSLPWFSTYKKDSIWFRYLPSLRRTMLVGIGLSLTSSFVYCVQLLYPPLLALWGGATMILGGALMNVLVARWSYRRFAADWLEEWRWRREVKRNKMHREKIRKHRDAIIHEMDEIFVSDGIETVKESEVK